VAQRAEQLPRGHHHVRRRSEGLLPEEGDLGNAGVRLPLSHRRGVPARRGTLFLQASTQKGGLGLTLLQKAVIDRHHQHLDQHPGRVSRRGLRGEVRLRRTTLLFLAICMNVPHVCYLYLGQAASHGTPLALRTILVFVTIEKFGYSFGFVRQHAAT